MVGPHSPHSTIKVFRAHLFSFACIIPISLLKFSFVITAFHFYECPVLSVIRTQITQDESYPILVFALCVAGNVRNSLTQQRHNPLQVFVSFMEDDWSREPMLHSLASVKNWVEIMECYEFSCQMDLARPGRLEVSLRSVH